MTRGYMTTEFWMTAAATGVGLMGSSGVFAVDSIWAKGLGLAAAALASAGYAVSRGIAKSASNN